MKITADELFSALTERCQKAEAEAKANNERAYRIGVELTKSHARCYKAEARVKELEKQQDAAYGYASRLATSIWEDEYKTKAPEWKALPDLLGILTQLDNMYAGVRNERDQALADLQAEKARLDWLPIETAPKDGTEITGGWQGPKPFTASGTPIVWQNTNLRSGWFALSPTYENDKGEFFPGKWIDKQNYPTHWRPLMDPPDAAQNLTTGAEAKP